jgi:hypothetical protein
LDRLQTSFSTTYFLHVVLGEVVEILKTPHVPFMVLTTDRPLALFSLYGDDTNAIIDRLSINEREPVDTFLTELSNQFRKMQAPVSKMMAQVPVNNDAARRLFGRLGFREGRK